MAARATPLPFRGPELRVVRDTEPAPPPVLPPALSELDQVALGFDRADLSSPEAVGVIDALLGFA